MRKVDCRNGLNGGTWRVVVDGGCGSDDRLRGGNPLQMADCFDDVDWHGVWEWVEMGWWWVKTTAAVAVTVFVPRGSCGGVGG